MTISTNGKVTDAQFPGLEITAECKYALRKEFLTITGFKAGKMKGENVISSYTYSIVCIKWEEG